MRNADETGKPFAVAQARRSVYEMLSGFFLELPDLKMVNSIFDPDFGRRLSAVASVFETGEIREGLRFISSVHLILQEEIPGRNPQADCD